MSENPVEQKAIDPKQAMDYLRSRTLYIATPAYGGFCTVNYINSLLGLVNMCRDIGIRHTISFKYNESLITRARNSMVDEYLRKRDETDFVFIDADIGFDPRDIITLMLHHDKKIIGAPCVRKSFNTDRLQALARSAEKPYSTEEFLRLGGEYVLNFPPKAVPDRMKLDDLIEVMDVGTGIMQVRREVFTEIADKPEFKDRWYLPMGGEGDRVPMFMFFQSGLDEESREVNPGNMPEYIPEDYAFCRLARKSGFKIWLAPWMKTSHMGSYMFQGDLIAVAKAGGRLR